MRVTTIENIQEFSELKSQWDLLYDKSNLDNPFCTFDWVFNWTKNYAKESQIQILLVHDSSELVGIVPLLNSSHNSTFLCDPFYADYGEIITKDYDHAVFDKIFNYLINNTQYKNLSLSPIRSIENTPRYFDKHLAHSKNWNKFFICKNPYIEVTGDFQTYFKTRKKKLRQEIRTTANKLNKLGCWDYTKGKTVEDKNLLFDTLTQLHQDRQKQKAGHSIFSSSQNIEFFKQLLHTKTNGFDLHISGITLNSKVCAAALNITTKNTFFYWIPSFDSSINLSSIGKLHLKYLLEETFNQNIKRFDFMGGTESYKLQWCDNFYEIHEYCYHSSRVGAYLHKKQHQLKEQLKNIKRQNTAIQTAWKSISKLSR